MLLRAFKSILGLFALFLSFNSYATNFGTYATAALAQTACNLKLTNYGWAGDCHSIGGNRFGLQSYIPSYIKDTFLFIPGGAGCVPPEVADSVGICYTVIVIDDAVCAARGVPTWKERYLFSSVDEVTEPRPTAVFDGCLYATSGELECFVGINAVNIICDITISNLGTGQLGTSQVGILDDIAEDNLNSGGVETKNNSQTPISTIVDDPSAGDSTSVDVNSTITSTTDEIEIDNFTERVDIKTLKKGDVTEVTTTTTITRSDGSVEITVNKTYQRNSSTINKTSIDNVTKAVSVTSQLVPQSTGSTITTNTVSSDGSSSTSTVTSGVGGSGSGDSGSNISNGSSSSGSNSGTLTVEIEGSDCLKDNSCNTTIDSTNATSAIDSLFDSALTTVTGSNISLSDFLPNSIQMPSGTCANPNLSFSGSGVSFNKTIDICTKTQDLRDGLGWLFFMMTLFTIYWIAVK